MNIRKSKPGDLSRIAEIYVFNNRVNYLPIFKDESFSFGDLQVVSMVDHYFIKDEIIKNLYVFDDGLIKGFIQMNGTEICKIYVDTFFQNEGIGDQLMKFAMKEHHADRLWALEKNARAISFYQKHGFHLTGDKKFEEGTTEYLVRMKTTIKYRRTTVDEASSMVDVYNKAFYDDYVRYGYCPGYGHSIEDMKASIFKNVKYSILYDDELIGAISVSQRGEEYYLGCLCVIPEYQGKGIGTQAMRFIEEELKDWKVITLETPVEKTENVKFYTEKCGFTITGKLKDRNVELYMFQKENGVGTSG